MSKTRVSAGLVSPEDQEGRLCPRPLSLVCRWLSSVWVLISSDKDASLAEHEPTRSARLHLHHLMKGPVSEYGHVLRDGG